MGLAKVVTTVTTLEQAALTLIGDTTSDWSGHFARQGGATTTVENSNLIWYLGLRL